jgi:UDP-2,4-diacetamido-2,4,6-trideoxy-beta-L-altropyranose hydrolase
VLEVIKTSGLPSDCQITVVMGSQARWQQEVSQQVKDMPWPTEVLVNTSDMARVIADSDLAIGAAGSTSWERCCLGVPTLLVVLADNQQPGARALQQAQAARLIGRTEDIATQLPLALDALMASGELGRMSVAASAVTEGVGAEKVIASLGGFHG